jgi:hypothetical protein
MDGVAGAGCGAGFGAGCGAGAAAGLGAGAAAGLGAGAAGFLTISMVEHLGHLILSPSGFIFSSAILSFTLHLGQPTTTLASSCHASSPYNVDRDNSQTKGKTSDMGKPGNASLPWQATGSKSIDKLYNSPKSYNYQGWQPYHLYVENKYDERMHLCPWEHEQVRAQNRSNGAACPHHGNG